MKIKVFLLSLVILLIFLAAGCSKETDKENDVNALTPAVSDEDTTMPETGTVIRWAVPIHSTPSSAVMKKINKVLAEEVDCTLEFVSLLAEEYNETTERFYTIYDESVRSYENENEPLDIVNVGIWGTATAAVNFLSGGSFMDIAPYLSSEDGHVLHELYSDIEWNCRTINGSIFSIPLNSGPYSSGIYVDINKKYIDASEGVDLSLEELLELYKTIGEEGDVIYTDSISNMLAAWYGCDFFERIPYSYSEGKFINPVDFNGIGDVLTQLYELAVNGKLIDAYEGVQKEKSFAYIHFGKEKNLGDKFFSYQLLGDNYIPALAGGNGISANSQNPEKALKVLELIYTNRELADLLSYGIEGTDYTLEDGYVKQINFYSGADFYGIKDFSTSLVGEEFADRHEARLEAMEQKMVTELSSFLPELSEEEIYVLQLCGEDVTCFLESYWPYWTSSSHNLLGSEEFNTLLENLNFQMEQHRKSLNFEE